MFKKTVERRQLTQRNVHQDGSPASTCAAKRSKRRLSGGNVRGETLKRRLSSVNQRGETCQKTVHQQCARRNFKKAVCRRQRARRNVQKAVERGERESNVWAGQLRSTSVATQERKKAGQLALTGLIYHGKDFTQCLPIIAIPRKTTSCPAEFLISLERR